MKKYPKPQGTELFPNGPFISVQERDRFLRHRHQLLPRGAFYLPVEFESEGSSQRHKKHVIEVGVALVILGDFHLVDLFRHVNDRQRDVGLIPLQVPLDHALESERFPEIHEEIGQVVRRDLPALVVLGIFTPNLPEILRVVRETIKGIIRVREIGLKLLDQHQHEQVQHHKGHENDEQNKERDRNPSAYNF
jgi:hypothetical protein